MESLTRAILGLALLIALRLGLKMKKGVSGRGNLADRNGMTIVRTFLVALLGPVMVWQLASPNTVPSFLITHIPDELRIVGLATFVAGMFLRIWSHLTLGKEWSADLSLRADHRLVQSGPYRWICHPIYGSYLAIAPGLLLSTGNWLIGGIAISYAFASALRVQREEDMLLERFGGTYHSYKRATLARQKNAAIALSIITVIALHTFGGVWELVVLF